MAGEVFIDALPYYDQGYDEPGVKEAVRPDQLNLDFVFRRTGATQA